MKKKFIKCIATIMITLSTTSVITMGLSERVNATEINYTQVNNYNSSQFEASWLKVLKNIAIKSTSKFMLQIPFAGPLASSTFEEVIGSLTGTQDDIGNKLDEMLLKLDGLANSITEILEATKFQTKADNIDTLLKNINSICRKLGERVESIMKAEKEGNKELAQQYRDIILSGDKEANKLYSYIDLLKDNLLGTGGIQSTDFIQACYNYCKSISDNKFASDAIAMSEKYEQALLNTYQNAVMFEVIYEKIAARDGKNSALVEDCINSIKYVINQHDEVLDDYKNFKERQFYERMNYIEQKNNEVSIRRINTKKYGEKDNKDISLPSDAININIINRIMQQYDGTGSLRDFLYRKGYEIDNNIKYLISSQPKRWDRGKGCSSLIDEHGWDMKVYDLDSKNNSPQNKNIIYYYKDPGFFGLFKKFEENYNTIEVAYFAY